MAAIERSSGLNACDPVAEQAILGIALTDKDAIADVRRLVQATHFYDFANRTIFETITALDDEGQPTEAAAVGSRLTREGKLQHVNNGAAYITDLVLNAPPTDGLMFYTRSVREAAARRELATIGQQMQAGSAIDGADTIELAEKMREKLDAVTNAQFDTEVPLISTILPSALEELDQLATNGRTVGVTSGLVDLDKLLHGFAPGQMITIAARPGVGKALALDTPLPTPSGWTTMGEVRVGDYLLDRSGHPTRVIAATDVMTDRPCYRVTFSDGQSLVADAQHQWVTLTRRERKMNRASVRTTEEIAETIRVGGKANHAVPAAEALDLPDVDLPVDPYTLGAWIGSTCRQDGEVVYPDGFQGITGEHIPDVYLRASVTQRGSLLAGLMDEVGTYVEHSREVVYSTTNPTLADDVFELVASLGLMPTRVTSSVDGGTVGALMTHAVRWDAPVSEGEPLSYRLIEAVERVPSVLVRCVEVDNPEHLYLAGRAMIPTHNSALAMDCARNVAFNLNRNVMVFSLEMSRAELALRMMSSQAFVDSQAIKEGKLTPEDWARMQKASQKMLNATLAIDDTATITMSEIRAKVKAFVRRYGKVDLIVIDYLQLMNGDSGRKGDNRQQEVSDISRAVKLLAKEFQVPVIVLSQLNRGSETRADKRPQLSDLRESGSIEQDSDVVILIHRAEMYEPESPKAGEADLDVAKQRSGPRGIVTVSWLGKYVTFQNMSLDTEH